MEEPWEKRRSRWVGRAPNIFHLENEPAWAARGAGALAASPPVQDAPTSSAGRALALSPRCVWLGEMSILGLSLSARGPPG